MKPHSPILCAAVLCAFTTVGFSQSTSATQHARPQFAGAASPDASAHFSVFLPLTNQAALDQLLIDQTNPASPSYHKWLTPAEFGAKFGPSPAAFAAVKARLQAGGLTVVKQHTQSIEVEGSVRDVEALLSMRIENVRMADGKIKQGAANHKMTLPTELVAVGAMIPSFAPHLARHVHSERLAAQTARLSPDFRLSSSNSFYYPNDMVEAYDFPSFLTTVTPAGGPAKQITGAGSTIGILMSSTIDPADLADTFNSTDGPLVQGFSLYTSVPVPTVTVEDVDGGSGPFGNDAAAEASLDTQMSLGTAPGAQEILYNIPDLSDVSISDGYTQIIDENKVDVVSSSFGGCEIAFTAAANNGTDLTPILLAEHNLYVQGNAQGITFLASSGDNGAAACFPADFWDALNTSSPLFSTNYVLGVESPASDPNVTGVGGTNLVTTATPGVDDAKYSVENANYDPRLAVDFGGGITMGNNTWGSGGGYSIVFGKPSYQALVNTGSATARAVPDVSLMMGGCPSDADLTAQDCTTLPRSASIVWIGGGLYLLIGTSSSSPQMAGVMALYDEAHGGRQGNINPLIYQLSALQTSASAKTASLSQYFHRAISGNNNGFTVVPGQAYSKVLGNGTLFVKTFLQLPSAAAAGAPNTVTNP